MALPASLSTATLQGTYVDLVGNPIRGSIVIRPQTILKANANNVMLFPVAVTITLDVNGSFSVVLPVTSDPDVEPQPFVYDITENFSGGREIQISLPLGIAGTIQNLADLTDAVTVAEAAAYVNYTQFNSLESRYTTAEGVRVIVVDADEYYDQAHDAAVTAEQAIDAIENFSARQLMMMGV